MALGVTYRPIVELWTCAVSFNVVGGYSNISGGFNGGRRVYSEAVKCLDTL